MAPTTKLSEIKLEDIEFEAVAQCTDKRVIKRYIKLLEDDGNYFQDLTKACKDKLHEIAPKDYYQMYPVKASDEEVEQANVDLLRWEDEVKATDVTLQKSRKDQIWDAPTLCSSTPVRGSDPVVARPNPRVKDKCPAKIVEEHKTPHDSYARDKTRMGDYYREWEKIDVDALEKEIDEKERLQEESRRCHFEELKEEQRRANATSPIETGALPENVPEIHRKHLADTEKDKGNEAFYAKDYDEAEAYYSRSIQLFAEDCAVWANRALVRLKVRRPQDALRDCEHALALNPRYMKALHRKGKALYELSRYADAVASLQLALAQSPGNTQINGDLMRARQRLRAEPSGPGTQVGALRKHALEDVPSTCQIEEIVDEEEDSTSTAKPEGYVRVVIEEDSDSDEDGGVVQGCSGGADVGDSSKFHKVPIVDASDSDVDDGSVDATQGTAANGKTFHKVPIEQADDDADVEGVVIEELMDDQTFHHVPIGDDCGSDEAEWCRLDQPACLLEDVSTVEENSLPALACRGGPAFFDDMD